MGLPFAAPPVPDAFDTLLFPPSLGAHLYPSILHLRLLVSSSRLLGKIFGIRTHPFLS